MDLDSNEQRTHMFEGLIPAFSECLITAAAGAAAILNTREGFFFLGFSKTQIGQMAADTVVRAWEVGSHQEVVVFSLLGGLQATPPPH